MNFPRYQAKLVMQCDIANVPSHRINSSIRLTFFRYLDQTINILLFYVSIMLYIKRLNEALDETNDKFASQLCQISCKISRAISNLFASCRLIIYLIYFTVRMYNKIILSNIVQGMFP